MDIFLATLFIVICVLLIIVVLLQKGRGGGLSAAFGGAGSSAFGTRTGDVFTWVTIVLTALFLILAVVTTLVYRPPPAEVEPPALNPAPKAIDETTVVTIANLPRKGTQYFYTLNGKDPKDSGQQKLYSGAGIKVEPGTVVKVIAYRDGRWSTPVAAAYPKAAPTTEPSTMEAVPTTGPTTGPGLLPESVPASAPASLPALMPASAPAKMPATVPAGTSAPAVP